MIKGLESMSLLEGRKIFLNIKLLIRYFKESFNWNKTIIPRHYHVAGR